jgi:hypothetical protein
MQGYLKPPPADIENVSGHSVRVGATQDLLTRNMDLASVMKPAPITVQETAAFLPSVSGLIADRMLPKPVDVNPLMLPIVHVRRPLPVPLNHAPIQKPVRG